MKEKYPIRINHYLAIKKYSTRRGGDELIKKGLIKINGKIANLGDKVFEKDKVEFLRQEQKESYVYYAYNKPINIVTNNPQIGEKSILNSIKTKEKIFPIGRLDKDSRGLIILTNDGRITDKILNPKFYHEKEYLVKVNKPITDIFMRQMRDGVRMGKETTLKCKVRRVEKDSFEIILTEGKNRQIRRMCRSLNYDVKDLIRERVMNIKLGNLKTGQLRKIEKKELEEFLKNSL
ncbi:MAG: RNA pseudouridine synthase [Candidatus Paceibacterota bacterium]|jgi:23S rRNA pseudouridine2604 synthase